MSSVANQSKIEVVPTTLDHCRTLSETMREEDRWEIWHIARSTPYGALSGGFEVSTYCRTVLLDGDVVCIFGIAGEEGRTGVPWMLASDLLKKIRKPFLRNAMSYLEDMSKGYKQLYNVAWTKNTEHIRWLKWMGFNFGVPKRMGPDNEYYVEFYKVN